jgi:hypothetical protein
MSEVRIQALADSGKAILRFRNGHEGSVTVASFFAGLESRRQNWSPLFSPVELKPGQMHSVDVGESVRRLFPPAKGEDPHEVRIRIRMLLDPEHTGTPREVDCVVTFHGEQCTQFVCH